MDPADIEHLKQAHTSHGQHEQTFQEVMNGLRGLAITISQLAAWILFFHSSSPPVPTAPAPVAAQGQSCESYTPIPARYSGDFYAQFLHQCNPVFDQQPLIHPRLLLS